MQITSWEMLGWMNHKLNQDCWEKYQQPQIYGWYHPNTLATWCKELTHWERPWCWERLKAGGERDDRGWVGWMTSQTPWIWVWESSWSWWWTGKPGVLQSMGSQRVSHDWETELMHNKIELFNLKSFFSHFSESLPMISSAIYPYSCCIIY